MDYQNCEELYEALETVKKACDGQCEICPMGNDEGTVCKITSNSPGNWSLKKPDPFIRVMEQPTSHKYRILERMLIEGQISRQEFKERIDAEYNKLEHELMSDIITPDEHI